MANSITVIGRNARVRGRLSGEVGLEIQGFVEGEISVGGDVTIDGQAMVDGNVRGRRLVVRGAVKGDLTAVESVLLEDGARVVGDVRAPRIAIGQGGLVRGYVQTAEGEGPSVPAARPQAGARPAVSGRGATPVVRVNAPAPPMGRAAARPEADAPSAPLDLPAGARASNHGGARRPPPPVVPALKKVKGQILKKRER